MPIRKGDTVRVYDGTTAVVREVACQKCDRRQLHDECEYFARISEPETGFRRWVNVEFLARMPGKRGRK